MAPPRGPFQKDVTPSARWNFRTGTSEAFKGLPVATSSREDLFMKICPKCKKIEDEAWEFCGACKTRLIIYKNPRRLAIIRNIFVICALLLTPIPLISLLVTHFYKLDNLPAWLAEILKLLANPVFVVNSLLVFVIALIIFVRMCVIDWLGEDDAYYYGNFPGA
jgi:hypothetical protein